MTLYLKNIGKNNMYWHFLCLLSHTNLWNDISSVGLVAFTILSGLKIVIVLHSALIDL